MTTEGRAAAAPSEASARARASAFVQRRMEAAMARPDAPEWMGQYVDTVLGVELDRFDPAEQDRPDLATTGRVFNLWFAELDRRLAGARTGRLIRTVVQGGNGGAYCYLADPGHTIIGFQRSGPPDLLAAIDEAMAGMLDRIREDMGQPDLNFGGFTSKHRDELRGIDPPAENGARSGPSGPAHVLGDTGDPLFERASAVLDGTVLHWLAVLQDRTTVFAADRFDDEAAANFFSRMTVDGRRDFYQVFLGELATFVRRLDRGLRGVLGGPLARLVLDVQQGALVVHRLGPRRHLLGITLNQTKVAFAEAALLELVQSEIPDNAAR